MTTTKITCPHCGNCDLEQFHWLENVVVHRRVLGIVGSILKIEAGDILTRKSEVGDLPTPTNRGVLMCMADGCWEDDSRGCLPVPADLKLSFIK